MPTKPTTLPIWATSTAAAVTEPSSGQKQKGHETGRKTPAGWQNWWQKLLYEWMAYLNAPVGTGTAPALTGTGDTGHGLKGIATANTAAGVAGEATGTLSSGVQGSTTDAAADGVKGLNTAATSSSRAGTYGKGSNSYGVTAESDTTSPKRAALRVVPQDADPVDQAKGDVQSDLVSGLLKGSNGTDMAHYMGHNYTTVADETLDNTSPGLFTGYTIKASTLRAGAVIRYRLLIKVADDSDGGNWVAGLKFGAANINPSENRAINLGDYALVEGCIYVRAAPGAAVACRFAGTSMVGPNGSAPDVRHEHDGGGANFATNADIIIRPRVVLSGSGGGNVVTLESFHVDIS